jgi:phosphatidylglycerol---prolipoprotein diacylglyceryl transferase
VPEYWVHNLSPFLIEFWPGVGIRWYGLAYLAGLFIGYWLALRWIARGSVPLTRNELQDFVLYCGLGMIIGGRVGYCLLYNFTGTLQNPLYIFQVYDGGMASHGGIVGMGLGCWWYAYKHKRNFWVLGDLVAATGTLGVGFGRLANFVNGELWGRPTTVPWAVIFPHSVSPPSHLNENQSAEILAWQIAHALPRHPSQLYAMMLEGFLIFAILLPIHARHRRPGLTCSLFLLLYACGRFFGEFFRQPDNGQPVFFDWLSKGQAYTLPMFIAGFALMYYVLRRPAQPDLYRAPVIPVTTNSPEKSK